MIKVSYNLLKRIFIYHLNSLIIKGDFFQTSNTVRKKRKLTQNLKTQTYKNFR